MEIVWPRIRAILDYIEYEYVNQREYQSGYSLDNRATVLFFGNRPNFLPFTRERSYSYRISGNSGLQATRLHYAFALPLSMRILENKLPLYITHLGERGAQLMPEGPGQIFQPRKRLATCNVSGRFFLERRYAVYGTKIGNRLGEV